MQKLVEWLNEFPTGLEAQHRKGVITSAEYEFMKMFHANVQTMHTNGLSFMRDSFVYASEISPDMLPPSNS